MFLAWHKNRAAVKRFSSGQQALNGGPGCPTKKRQAFGPFCALRHPVFSPCVSVPATIVQKLTLPVVDTGSYFIIIARPLTHVKGSGMTVRLARTQKERQALKLAVSA
jgi:hypothetical protein